MNRLLADREEQKPIVILYHKEDKETLINDVLNKKRDAYFKPKYKLAPLTKTTQKRPQEFPGGFEEWFNDMRKEYSENIRKKREEEQIREQLLMTIELDYTPKIMQRFMKVY